MGFNKENVNLQLHDDACFSVGFFFRCTTYSFIVSTAGVFKGACREEIRAPLKTPAVEAMHQRRIIE